MRPKSTRIIDNRHEEIGRRDDAGVLVDLPYGSIIRHSIADRELGEWLRYKRT
ncbi:hypothetical protein FHT76_005245 [Rhizobium sp. BK176]|nr:hypothetical protein [Rhizobium sp. BK399]MCS4093551.1 hypothetical protein [Rhizobium sp. BK176]